MEFKWLMIAMAIASVAICGIGIMGAYSDGQVKIAEQQTLSRCYDAAKVNPNIKCDIEVQHAKK